MNNNIHFMLNLILITSLVFYIFDNFFVHVGLMTKFCRLVDFCLSFIFIPSYKNIIEYRVKEMNEDNTCKYT